MVPVPIIYFSDVLCIWAFIAQLRLDEAKLAFDGRIEIDRKFCSVFGATSRKIAVQWGAKGGYEGFNAHLLHAAEAFPEVRINPGVWRTVRPASSMGPHLFLKAAQIAEAQGQIAMGASEAATRGMRAAFFEEGLDVARWPVQCDVGRAADIDLDAVEALIRDGSAFAALASDYQDAETMGIQGSPSFVLNEGRQKLFGNVGYRIIEANIQELLRDPHPDQASWC
jgi:predicted DsbA family dithiol-disulfide isomerase